MLLIGYNDNIFEKYIKTFKIFENLVDFEWDNINKDDFLIITEILYYFNSFIYKPFKNIKRFNLKLLRTIFPINIALKFIFYNNYGENNKESLNIQTEFMMIIFKFYLKDIFKNLKIINFESIFIQSPIEREIIRKINLKNEDCFEFNLYPGKILNLKIFLIDLLLKYGSYTFLKNYYDIFDGKYDIIKYILKSIYLLLIYGFLNYTEVIKLLNSLHFICQNFNLIEKELEWNFNCHRKLISKILIQILLYLNDDKLLNEYQILKDINKKSKKELNIIDNNIFNNYYTGIINITTRGNFKKKSNYKVKFINNLVTKGYIRVDYDFIEIEYINETKTKKKKLYNDIDIEDEINQNLNIFNNKNNYFFEDKVIYQKILLIIFKFLSLSYNKNLFINRENESEYEITNKKKILNYINILFGFIIQLDEDDYLLSINLLDSKIYDYYLNNYFNIDDKICNKLYYEIINLKNQLMYFNDNFDLIDLINNFKLLVASLEKSIIKVLRNYKNKIKHIKNRSFLNHLNKKKYKSLKPDINNKQLVLIRLLENGSIENYLFIIYKLVENYKNIKYKYRKFYKNVIREAIMQFSFIFKEKQFIKCLFSFKNLKILDRLFNFLKFEVSLELLKLIRNYDNYFIFLDKSHSIFNFLNKTYEGLLKSLDLKNLKKYISNSLDFKLTNKKKSLIKTIIIFSQIFKNLFEESYKKLEFEKFDLIFQNTLLPYIETTLDFIKYYFDDKNNNDFKNFNIFLKIIDYDCFNNLNSQYLIINLLYGLLNLFNYSIDTFIGKNVYTLFIKSNFFENMKKIYNLGNINTNNPNFNIYYRNIGPIFRKNILKLITSLFIFPSNKTINNQNDFFNYKDLKNNFNLQVIPEIYSKKEFFDLLSEEFRYQLIFKNFQNKKDEIYKDNIKKYFFNGYFPLLVIFLKGIVKLITQSNQFFYDFKHNFKKYLWKFQSNFEDIKILLKLLENDILNKRLHKINNLFVVINNYLNIKEDTIKSKILDESNSKVKQFRKDELNKTILKIDKNQTWINNIRNNYSLEIGIWFEDEKNKIYPEISNLKKSINYIINIISYLYEATSYYDKIKNYLNENDNIKIEKKNLYWNKLSQSYYNSKNSFLEDKNNFLKKFILKENITDKNTIIYFLEFIAEKINNDFKKHFSINKNWKLKINFLRYIIHGNNSLKEILLNYVTNNSLLIKNIYYNFKKLVYFLIFKPFKDKSYIYIYEFFNCYRLFIQETCEDNYYPFKIFYNTIKVDEYEEESEVYINSKIDFDIKDTINIDKNNEDISRNYLNEFNNIEEENKNITIFKDYFSLITIIFKYSNVSRNNNKLLTENDRKDTFKLASDLIYSYREFVGNGSLMNNLYILKQYSEIKNFKGILERNINILNSAFYNLKFEIIEFFLILIEGNNKVIKEYLSKILIINDLYDSMIKMVKLLYVQNYNYVNKLPPILAKYNSLKWSANKNLNKLKIEKKNLYKVHSKKTKYLNLIKKNKYNIKHQEKELLTLEKQEETIINYFTNIIYSEQNEWYIINDSNILLHYYIDHPEDKFASSPILNICFSFYNIFKILENNSKRYSNFMRGKELYLQTFKNDLIINFQVDGFNYNENDFWLNKNKQIIEEDIYILNFIIYIMKPVELINNKNNLITYYFPKKPESFFLIEVKKESFINTLKLDSSVSNQKDIIYNTNKFRIEMKHEYVLYHKLYLLYKLSNSYTLFKVKILIWIFSFVQNFFLLIGYTRSLASNRQAILKSNFYRVVLNVFSAIIIFLSFFFILVYILGKLKIKYKISLEIKFENDNKLLNFIKLWFNIIILNEDLIPLILHLIFSILALSFNDYFISLHLLLLLYLNNVIKDVFKSTIEHLDQLLSSIWFAIIIIFVYSLILAQYYADGLNEDLCRPNIIYCFFNIITKGLRNVGGIADNLNVIQNNDNLSLKLGRFFFDFSFFFIINIIFLNLIKGIIIDTFSEKRKLKNDKEIKLNTECIICGLNRFNLEKNGISFDNHIKYNHNPFNYIDFIVYIYEKNKKDFNSLEYEIYKKILKEENNWIPNGKTDKLKNKSEDLVEIVLENLKKFNSVWLQNKMIRTNLIERENETNI